VGIVLVFTDIILLLIVIVRDRSMFLIPGISSSNLGQEDAYTESFRGFLQSFQEHAGIEHKLDQHRLFHIIFYR
jgi:hypothetical protein